MKNILLFALSTCCILSFSNGQRSDNYGYKPPPKQFRPPSQVIPTPRPSPPRTTVAPRPQPPPRPAQSYGPPTPKPRPAPTPRPRPPATYGPPQNVYQSPSNQVPSVQYPGMPYDFQWGIDDHQSGNSYSHTESSDGNTMQGQYQVLLPDGRLQVVKFFDNGGGYVADVTYQ